MDHAGWQNYYHKSELYNEYIYNNNIVLHTVYFSVISHLYIIAYAWLNHVSVMDSVEGHGPCRLCSKDRVADGHNSLILKQQHIIMIQNVTGQSILWVSKYGRISILLRLPLSDFKLQASHTVMLSNDHFTCCWKHGIITQMIRVLSREPGHTQV